MDSNQNLQEKQEGNRLSIKCSKKRIWTVSHRLVYVGVGHFTQQNFNFAGSGATTWSSKLKHYICPSLIPLYIWISNIFFLGLNWYLHINLRPYHFKMKIIKVFKKNNNKKKNVHATIQTNRGEIFCPKIWGWGRVHVILVFQWNQLNEWVEKNPYNTNSITHQIF